MQLFILSLLIGILEISAITQLYQEIGLINSIYLYIAGTSIGGIILLINWKEAKTQYQEIGNFDKSVIKRLKNRPYELSEDDAKKVKIVYQSILFTLAIIFVFIPGLVSDFLGTMLAPLAIRSKISTFIIKTHTD
jgi:UPF0716 family protein affecting phage T7 exclusion